MNFLLLLRKIWWNTFFCEKFNLEQLLFKIFWFKNDDEASYDHKYDKFYLRFQSLEKMPIFDPFCSTLVKDEKKYSNTKVKLFEFC